MIFRNLEPQTFVPNFRHLPLQGRCCSMTSWFHLVDFQCCGKGLRTDNDGKTISSLRLYNAICVNNIDFGSTTKRLKPRSGVEVSFWTSEVILISIEENNDLSICQKETFILILIHPHPCQSFPSFMCKYFLVRQSQRKFCNPSRSWHEWPAGADVEVPRCQMQILKQYPRYAWLKSASWKHWLWLSSFCLKADCYLEVPLESQTTNPNHQLTICWDVFVDIFWGNPWWLSGFCLIFILDVV